MNKAAAQAQVVFNERMKDTNNNLADSTEFTKKFLEKWGLDAIMRGVQMKPVGEEERARIDAQAAATKEFYTGVKDLKKEWNDWMDEMSTSALSPDGVVVTGLHLAISLTKTLHELWEKPLTKQVAKGTFDTMSFMIPGVNTVKFWKWITDLYQSSGKDEKGLGDQLGLDSLPKAKDGEADGEAKATHLLSSMADDNEEYKNTMKDNTGQLKRLNDYLAAQQLGINVPPGDGGGVATPGGGAAPASAGPGPSTGPPSTAGPSTGPSSAAPSPAAAPSSGMGNLGAPEFDAFTKGAKSMGAIGANTPEAAAAAMAGGGTTTATTPATQKSNEDVLAETAKWVRDKESFTPRNEPDFGQRKIGYGTDPKGRTSITEPEARKEEEDYLAGSLKRINDMNPNLSRGQKIALASLDFNTGWTQRGGEKNEALRAAIKAGDVGAARKLFGTYTHVGGPKGRELPGLVTRRQEELSIFDTPDKKSESEKGSIAGDRATVDKKSIKVVKVDATGKVAVNIGADKGDDVTLGSKRLFKPTAPERSTQMVPAETGPKASTFAETAD
jgi:GH24 family phage-related lysozyme (muramidase)